MTLPFYLAMTGWEAEFSRSFPEKMAWMACHFSTGGKGLSNLPGALPPGSVLMLNDAMPYADHDPEVILAQLENISCEALVLDLQRPGVTQVQALCRFLDDALPYPVAVTEFYATELTCPVFLSAPPVGVALKDHMAPWKGRSLWLEAVTDRRTAVVTEAGCRWEYDGATPEEPIFLEPSLHLRYSWRLEQDRLVVHLERSRDELPGLLEEAESLGFTAAIGLYRQTEKANP